MNKTNCDQSTPPNGPANDDNRHNTSGRSTQRQRDHDGAAAEQQLMARDMAIEKERGTKTQFEKETCLKQCDPATSSAAAHARYPQNLPSYNCMVVGSVISEAVGASPMDGESR